MKKLTILFAIVAIALLLLSLSGNVYAQDEMGTRTTGFSAKGFKVGVNLANWHGSDATITGADKKMRVGFVGGLFATYLFSDMIGLELDALYAMKGVKYKSSSGPSVTVTDKIDYIEIPLLLTVAPTMEGAFKPIVFAGPEVGFRINAKEHSSLGGGDVKIDSLVKSTDFGIVFGAGAGYKMTPTSGLISLEVRYDLGLSKIADVPSGVTAPNIKNGVISILLGYGF